MKSERFEIHNGDCIEVLAVTPANTFDFSVYSPPFASLYTYTDDDRDMGNCLTLEEFFEHFDFLAPQLYRTLKPGRLMSFHCMNLPSSKERDGVIGLKDFRGKMIAMFEKYGFIFHSEACIWKDPVTAMQRTKAIGLLYKQLRKDSALSRQGIPDYLVTMRKPGDNMEAITHVAPPAGSTFKHARNVPENEFSVDQWQQWASPVWNDISNARVPAPPSDCLNKIQKIRDGGVLTIEEMEGYPLESWQTWSSPVWMDIDPGDTLQYTHARTEKDERHICPLQLEVIRRAIILWSNKGDLVLSPFAGIGSEGHEALLLGRRFFGIELKPEYYQWAVKNLQYAESAATQPTLFDGLTETEES